MDDIHQGRQINHPKTMCSSMDEIATKIRKPYTITKQRERWTEDEHRKFLEALKLHGRAWRRIEEHIGTKTAVQIRSHAQKFFSKVSRDPAMGEGSLDPIDIPPPRPKRKPVHPYPRKLGKITSSLEERSPSPVSSLSGQENRSPTSVLSGVGSLHLPDTCGSSAQSGGEENGSPVDYPHMKADLSEEATGTTPTSLKLFGRTVLVASASKEPSSPIQEQESQRAPSSSEWSSWPWGMMPQIIYCPSAQTEPSSIMPSIPWWPSMHFMPLTSSKVNPLQKQRSDPGVDFSREETASSSENEGRGFVPYRKAL